MQDIVRITSRGRIQPDGRPDITVGADAARRVVYERQTTVISDIRQGTRPPVHREIEVVSTVESLSQGPSPEFSHCIRGVEDLSAKDKQLALERALARARRDLTKERLKARDWKRFSLVFAAGLFVLLTGYVSIDTWMTNNRVKAETDIVAGDYRDAATGTWAPSAEGKDETKPTPQATSTYTVAPSLPRMLHISKLGVAARILPMSVNSDGAVQSPLNIYDAGWYTGSVKPGEIGAVFIDGHASGPTREGLFGSLDTLKKGDTLQVEKGDGTTLTYRVVKTETLALDKVDMKKALLPLNGVTRGLNLMTCTGEWSDEKATFDHRIIVYTEQIS